VHAVSSPKALATSIEPRRAGNTAARAPAAPIRPACRKLRRAAERPPPQQTKSLLRGRL